MVDKIKYVSGLPLRSTEIVIGGPGVQNLVFSRAEALELFKQLSKELGFETDFDCHSEKHHQYAGAGPCKGPTVFEIWGSDGESTWYHYVCEGHLQLYRQKEHTRPNEIRDMREIPKEKA